MQALLGFKGFPCKRRWIAGRHACAPLSPKSAVNTSTRGCTHVFFWARATFYGLFRVIIFYCELFRRKPKKSALYFFGLTHWVDVLAVRSCPWVCNHSAVIVNRVPFLVSMLSRVTITANQFKVFPVQRHRWVIDILRRQVYFMVYDFAGGYFSVFQAPFA